MTNSHRAIIFAGAGYLANWAAATFAADGFCAYTVRRRHQSAEPGREARGIVRLRGDAGEPDSWWPDRHIDILAVTLSPAARDYPGLLERLTSAAAQRDVEQIIFCSSAGVYSERGGNVVDEDAPLDRASSRGAALVAAEELVTRGSPSLVTVLRFSGIYGPGRSPWHRYLLQGEPLVPENEDAWTNRIHVEDAARAMLFVAARRLGGVFNVTDDHPATVAEIRSWIARQGPAPSPPGTSTPAWDTDSPEPARRRTVRAGSKRVSARRLRALGWDLVVPGFQEGWQREHPAFPGK